MSRGFTSSAFKVARTSATVRSIARGTPARRVKNVAVGRGLGKAGVWRSLWK